ncbi:MAG: hypothetical protein IT337_05670 [Thermomicrobiales bacterium]|nr:hypothetical protein [Thermomicrobiales bacterium]
MRLRICDIDLFRPDNDETRAGEPGWLPLGPVTFATLGLLCLRIVPRLGHGFYPLDEWGESLLFKADGQRTLVHSTMTGITVGVPFERLECAWAAFAQRLRARFRTEHPGFADDPIWQAADDVESSIASIRWDRLYAEESGGKAHWFDSIDRTCLVRLGVAAPQRLDDVQPRYPTHISFTTRLQPLRRRAEQPGHLGRSQRSLVDAPSGRHGRGNWVDRLLGGGGWRPSTARRSHVWGLHGRHLLAAIVIALSRAWRPRHGTRTGKVPQGGASPFFGRDVVRARCSGTGQHGRAARPILQAAATFR